MEGIIKTDLLKDDLDTFINLYSKLAGYPFKGTHVNEDGINVDLDGVNKDGWSLCYCEPFKNTVNTDWAIIIDSTIENDIADSNLHGNVTSTELLYLQTELLNKVTLNSTWFSDDI